MEISLVFIDEETVNTPTYIKFFELYHGVDSFVEWQKKIHWYFSWGDYKILVAKADGEYVGQNCAYKTRAIINGEEKEIWWGVDAFVLETMRGKGVGKKLQMKMHEDLPNFTSASYSTLNGIIKRKCGAKNLLDLGFNYYPVSCYFSVMAELVMKRIFIRKARLPRIRMSYLYSCINGAIKGIGKYDVAEIEKGELPEYASFMEDCIAGRAFHPIRSKVFLKWKYADNPMIRFTALAVSKDNELIGVIVVSEPFIGTVVVTKTRIAKIYDCIVKPGSGITEKQLILVAIKHLWKRGVKVDGVMALQQIVWLPRLTYPYPCSHLLSTIETDKLNDGYISYIDQDMERMN